MTGCDEDMLNVPQSLLWGAAMALVTFAMGAGWVDCLLVGAAGFAVWFLLPVWVVWAPAMGAVAGWIALIGGAGWESAAWLGAGAAAAGCAAGALSWYYADPDKFSFGIWMAAAGIAAYGGLLVGLGLDVGAATAVVVVGAVVVGAASAAWWRFRPPACCRRPIGRVEGGDSAA